MRESPSSPTISEVLAITAPGMMPLTAVSAAALAAPYGDTGSGWHVSS